MRRLVPFALLLTAGCATLGGPGGLWRTDPISDQAESYNYYLKSVMLEQQGRAEEAVEALQKASNLAPGNANLQTRLTEAYYGLQEYEKAKAACERAAELRPDDAGLQIVLAGICRQLEQYGEADAALERALDIGLDTSKEFTALVMVEESMNDLVAAIDLYKKLIEMNPASETSAVLYYQLGMNLARIHDSEGARAAFEKALVLRPNYLEAQLFLGLTYLELQREEDAVRQFMQFLAHTAQRAGSLRALPEELREQLGAMLGASGWGAQAAVAREHLAGALARMGHYEEAITALEPLFTNEAAAPRHQVEAMYLLLRAERFDEAQAAAPPEGAPIFGTLFRALARKRQGMPYAPLLKTLDGVEGRVDEEAQRFLSELMSLYGREQTGQFFIAELEAVRDEGLGSRNLDLILARVYMTLDLHKEAESLLLGTLNAYGPDKWAHYYLAMVYEELDQFPETEEHLKACLDIDPTDAEVMNFLGYLYAEENVKLDKAERLLKKALAQDPGNGFFLDSLGWIYYRKGEAEKAITHIRKAIVAMDTDDAILRDHLGDAYLLNGAIDRALGEWRRARRLDPELEGVQEKIDKYSEDEAK